MPTLDWILHVDLDQFLAAVEVMRRPELRGRPVVVGATSDLARRRTVVATASYEAREFGVRSGMSMRTAARLCPDAVFLPSDKATYEEVSEQVMATLRTLPAVVEVLGWDEAFLGASTDDREEFATAIQGAVATTTGLSCAVGIGDNQLRAKIATTFAKPGGIYRLTDDNWMAVMGERRTDALWGIGRKTATKLADLGLVTVEQLAAADRAELAARFGPTMGPYYRKLAFGLGNTVVTSEPWVPRSRSHETTFEQDLTERAEVEEQITALARQLADEAAAEGRTVVRVAVKVRFAPFFTRIRSKTLAAPTHDADDIERAALEVLERFEHHRPVRLLGVRVEFEDLPEVKR